MPLERQMPRYRCHKEVYALKIKSFQHREDNRCFFFPAEEGYAPIELSAEYVAKHRPRIGGYYVVYDDGYLSFSPALPFEEGYTRIK